MQARDGALEHREGRWHGKTSCERLQKGLCKQKKDHGSSKQSSGDRSNVDSCDRPSDSSCQSPIEAMVSGTQNYRLCKNNANSFHSCNSFCKHRILQGNPDVDLGFTGHKAPHHVRSRESISLALDSPPPPNVFDVAFHLYLGDSKVILAPKPVDFHLSDEPHL